MKKYRKCKVVLEDELKEIIDLKTIELVMNEKGQIYNRAKIRELERRLAENVAKQEEER